MARYSIESREQGAATPAQTQLTLYRALVLVLVDGDAFDLGNLHCHVSGDLGHGLLVAVTAFQLDDLALIGQLLILQRELARLVFLAGSGEPNHQHYRDSGTDGDKDDGTSHVDLADDIIQHFISSR